MTVKRTTLALGRNVYGLAAIMMGIAGWLWRDFAVGWIAVPPGLPGRSALACLVGAILVVGGAMINLQRAAAWGAAVLTALFAIGLVLLDLTRLATHLSQFDYWELAAEQLALVTGGVIALVSSAGMDASAAARLEWTARTVFALCLFIFGAAHFVFADFSATFVPKWIPPGQMFWVYLTGVAHIAAGLAIVCGIVPLLAARLLVAMYVSFGISVHLPRVWSGTTNHGNWVEFIVNLALVGVAWIVADSLARKQSDVQ